MSTVKNINIGPERKENVLTKYKFYLSLCCLLSLLFGQETFCAENRLVRRHGESQQLTRFCDVMNDPGKYDGKEITVSATYMYGFEWQELLCLDCHHVGKTWLEFDEDDAGKLKKALKKAPKTTGTINAIFSGIFKSSGGPYGDGGYRYQFIVKRLSHVEVIYKNGLSVEALPPSARRRVCGSIITHKQ